MRKLHLVGLTPDGEGLVLAGRRGAKSGGFVVPLDAELQRLVADPERRRGGASSSGPTMPDRDRRLSSPRLVRPESALSPREMQDRIRAGWSVEDVAAEAGVDLDWVGRFAAPVLAEIARVLDEVRTLTFDKPRVGPSGTALGAAVRRNLFDRGVVLGEDAGPDEGWSAFQVDVDRWVVRFEYRSRGRQQVAEWLFDPADRSLVSRNRLAGQLAYVAPRRERAPAPAGTRRAPARKSTRTASGGPSAPPKASARRATPRKAAARKAAGRAVPARKAAPRKATGRAVPARKAPRATGRRAQPPAPAAAGAPAPRPGPPVAVRALPAPGAVAVDRAAGIAKIDSRRSVGVPPVFRPAPAPPPPPLPARPLPPPAVRAEPAPPLSPLPPPVVPAEPAPLPAPLPAAPRRAPLRPVFRGDLDRAGQDELGNRGPLPPPPPVRRRRDPLRAAPE